MKWKRNKLMRKIKEKEELYKKIKDKIEKSA